MFSTRVRKSVFYNKANLTNVILSNNSHSSKHYFFRYSFTIREVSVSDLLKEIQYVKQKMKVLLENGTVLQSLRETFKSIPQTLKHQSAGVLRIWAHQCECVLAQRLRRGQQMFCLYTRLWEERALKDLLIRMRHQISKHSKELMLSACGIASYNWDSNRISDNDLKKHIGELDYISLLKEKTLLCETCKKRECSVRNTDCCVCPHKPKQKRIFDKWMPFIEKKDIMVWRRLHSSGTGHYEYKVYGSFNDVSAEDFLNVQIDSEYRRQWDATAIMLEVIECDPNPTSNSEIIYWEMRWPKLFINRDYVFNRRFLVDPDRNTVIIISRGTDHPACPVRTDKYRVDDYWSEMVIKSYTDMDKPGIEFGLTYFDNPGVSIPATVTTWVAMHAMPEFLMRLRRASLDYKLYCDKAGKEFIYSCSKNIHDGRNRTDENDFYDNVLDEFIIDNTIFEAQHPIKGGLLKSSSRDRLQNCEDNRKDMETNNKPLTSGKSDSDVITSPTTVIKSEINTHDYWKYFKPNYYFS